MYAALKNKVNDNERAPIENTERNSQILQWTAMSNICLNKEARRLLFFASNLFLNIVQLGISSFLLILTRVLSIQRHL